MRHRRAWLALARAEGRIPDGPGLDHSIRVYPASVPVKRSTLTGTHTRTALRTRYLTLTKGILLPIEPHGTPDKGIPTNTAETPEEFRIPAENCGGFRVDIISRARAHWLLNTTAVIGYWAAAAYHGLPYWCDNAPVVLLTRGKSCRDARSWRAECTPNLPVFRTFTKLMGTVHPDPEFPDLPVVSADLAVGQCLHSLLRGTHGWDVPEVPGLSAREVRAIQFLDAIFQCTRLSAEGVRLGCRNLVDAHRLDQLLVLSDHGAQSPRETLLRLYVRNALPNEYAWTSQVTVMLDPDNRPWKHLIADLACVELRVAVFYDGAYHRAQERRSLDFRQIQRLHALGWDAVRVDATLMADADTMMTDIHDAVARAVARVTTGPAVSSSEQDAVSTSQDGVSASRDSVSTSQDGVLASQDSVSASRDSVSTSKDNARRPSHTWLRQSTADETQPKT